VKKKVDMDKFILLSNSKKPILSIIHEHIIKYLSPLNLSYLWGFGSLAGITLVIQIISGLFLAMHYTANIDYAFNSVENIMRNVNNGWLFRYIHANGASMFFLLLYLHLFRALYYISYIIPRIEVWVSGVLIFLLVMATAFLGYILPWGQMSFWGATVITNIFGTLPQIGQAFVLWLWGGFSVDNPTLQRFFILHFLLPFVILVLVIVHLMFLHKNNSGTPSGTSKPTFSINFYPYFYLKDLFGFFIFLFIFSYFVFFNPNYLGHSDNYIPANPMVTPAHIVPEWYFLTFYAILRSIPDKLLGVIAMFLAIMTLLILPFMISQKFRNGQYRPLFPFFYWWFIVTFILLGWIGGNPVEYPFVLLGQILTFNYFYYLILLTPCLPIIEGDFLQYAISKKIHTLPLITILISSYTIPVYFLF
jgi:quinol-cytochrome oxidoreductase complex cytochrome b subunit